jgi:hypothetical protein
MKKLKSIFTVFIISSIFIFGCKKETEITGNEIFPENFSVDIPSSLSSDNSKAIKSEVLNGNLIYLHLQTFIFVGEGAGEIVESIMNSIREYNLSQEMTFSIQSEEDGRTKNFVIVEQSEFEGQTWEYELTMTDADSENNEDGGMALQIFWNKSPINGIAILKPYNINRTENELSTTAVFRVDYTEARNDYEAAMTVYISGLPVPSPLVEPYAMETLKMFAGKKGDIIDVYGNSNQPNAAFFSTETGFNWAFVASGNDSLNIATAEVGLPYSSLNTTDREVILKDNSIYNVFYNSLVATWPNVDPIEWEAYLQNTQAPGYFGEGHFIQGGTAPSDLYYDLSNSMNLLSPYNPFEISNLSVEFKTNLQ